MPESWMRKVWVVGSLLLVLSACVHQRQVEPPPAAVSVPPQAAPMPPTPEPAPEPEAATPPITPAPPTSSAPPPKAAAAAPAPASRSAAVAPAATPTKKLPPATAAPVTAPPPALAAPPAPAPAAASPSLDLASLEQRLRDTHAIGVFTKLSIKNQVDDLLAAFKGFHGGKPTPTLADLRQKYELLLLKVVSVLQDGDAQLASAVASSREAIWGVLADPRKFSQISAS
jgi:hypothetical protein